MLKSAHPRKDGPHGRFGKKRQRLSIGAATAWFAACYGAAVLGYLSLNAIAARFLESSFGYFVVAMTVSTFIGQLGLLGVHRGGLREAARLRPEDVQGRRDLRDAVRAVSLVSLPIVSAVTALACFVIIPISDSYTKFVLALGMGLLVWFGGQQKLLANYLRGFGYVRFASLLEGRSGGALVSTSQAVVLLAMSFFAPGLQLSGAIASLVIGYAVPVFAARRILSEEWRDAREQGPIFANLRSAISRNWQFAANLLSGYLNSTVEIWIAGLLLSSGGLSLFSAAQRLSLLTLMPLVSIGVVFSPMISRLYAAKDKNLEPLIRTGATAAALTAAAVWLPMILWPGAILQIVYGEGYSAASPVLVILIAGTVSSAITGLCGTALAMSQHEAVVSSVQWTALSLRIALGAVAAMFFGEVALAVSAAAVSIATQTTLWVLCKHRLRLSTHPTSRPNFRLIFRTSS